MDFSVNRPPSPEHLEGAKRIEVKPRVSGAGHRVEETPVAATSDSVLKFSCPACLHLLEAAKTSATISVKCPECSAWVLPPQLVSATASKTVLPPPKKSGDHPLRH